MEVRWYLIALGSTDLKKKTLTDLQCIVVWPNSLRNKSNNNDLNGIKDWVDQ